MICNMEHQAEAILFVTKLILVTVFYNSNWNPKTETSVSE